MWDTLILPVSTLILATFLIVLFFCKRRIENIETEIYKKLLIINLIDTVLAIVTYILAKTLETNIVIQLLQKVYMSLMILKLMML